MEKMYCSRGHEKSGNNLFWVVGPKGKRYPRCRLCVNMCNKLRYRHNPEHRAKVKAGANDRYYRTRRPKKGNNHVG